MKKLRKMLGNVTSQECLDMMHLIETQSKLTLIKWSVMYAKHHYLHIYQQLNVSDKRLPAILDACEAYGLGSLKLAEIKPLLKEATTIARDANEDPVLQASARAIACACSVIQTPTSALGFLFYGCACVAYHQFGVNEVDDFYEQVAVDEFKKAYQSLQCIAVLNEKNPVKIKWNC